MGFEPRATDQKSQALNHCALLPPETSGTSIWGLSSWAPYSLASLAPWLSLPVLPAWVSFLLSTSQLKPLASLGLAQGTSSSFQVRIRWQDPTSAIRGSQAYGSQILASKHWCSSSIAEWNLPSNSLVHMQHSWLRIWPFGRVTANDCHLLSRMG